MQELEPDPEFQFAGRGLHDDDAPWRLPAIVWRRAMAPKNCKDTQLKLGDELKIQGMQFQQSEQLRRG